MSIIVHTRGEVGGGVAAHLRCSYCDHLSKSHAHQLSHIAASHPSCLDNVVFGRLGNILIYQSMARLFHCASCFYTTHDFTKLYTHIITTHCLDERDGGGDVKMVVQEERDKLADEVKDKKMEDEGEDKKMVDKDEDEKMMDDGKEKKEKVVDKGEDEVKEELLEKIGEEEEEAVKRKWSSEADEGHKDNGTQQVAPPDVEAGDCVLMFDGAYYHCLFCDFKNKMKVLGLNHVVKKHGVSKTYALRAIRQVGDTAPRLTMGVGPEEEEAAATAGLSKELLKEEKEVLDKVVQFISNRYVCQICGWKTKLKGFVISHVVRSHDVQRPYGCPLCCRSFFLPSRLQQHVRSAHRPGRYACPFCCFRSQYLGGFRRHCSRCNAREQEQQQEGGGRAEDKEEEEERKGTRGERKRKREGRVMEEEDGEDED